MSCRPGCDKHVHSPDALLKMWANRLNNNQHVVWGAFGLPGSGKSEGNVFLAIQLQELLGSGPFDVRRQVAFRPVDRKPMAQALPKFKVILDDEATGEGGHKRRSMSTANVNNVQDLDACRGRNQANGFATIELGSLDAEIQRHLMGYFEWHPDHSCEWFEAIRGGDQWNRWVHWESRFTVTKTPWLQEHHPAVGKEYLAAKHDHMHGRDPNRVDSTALEDKFYSIVSRAL